LILPHRNVQMDRARMWLEHKAMGAGPRQPLPDTITYDVKLSSPYFLAPRTVTVSNGNRTDVSSKSDSKQHPRAGTNAAERKASNSNTKNESVDGKGGSVYQNSKLSLEFRPKEPGVYPCTVTLTSDVDIRITRWRAQARRQTHIVLSSSAPKLASTSCKTSLFATRQTRSG